MENLNQANFFNDLEKECPEAVQHFYAWLVNYKIEVHWLQLFGQTTRYNDLPYEMQVGIFMRYQLEHVHKDPARYAALKTSFIGQICSAFIIAQSELNNLKNKF